MAGKMIMSLAGAGGSPADTVVDIAEAGAKISDIVRQEATKAAEQERTDDNEFNIRKQFLDNAVEAIKQATYSQYNIVICTDQEHDDFQDLTGQVLPMDLIEVTVAQNKTVNFQVYVFETGKYLRRGKWERDFWWWFGENKTFYDVAMHVHFENAQPKKSQDEIQTLIDAKAAQDKTAADAQAAATAAQNKANTGNSAQIKQEADLQKDKAKADAEKAQGVIPEGGDDEEEDDREEPEEDEEDEDKENGDDDEEEDEEEEEDKPKNKAPKKSSKDEEEEGEEEEGEEEEGDEEEGDEEEEPEADEEDEEEAGDDQEPEADEGEEADKNEDEDGEEEEPEEDAEEEEGGEEDEEEEEEEEEEKPRKTKK